MSIRSILDASRSQLTNLAAQRDDLPFEPLDPRRQFARRIPAISRGRFGADPVAASEDFFCSRRENAKPAAAPALHRG